MSLNSFSLFSEGNGQSGALFCDVGRLAPVIASLLGGKTYRRVSAEIYDEPPDGLPPDPDTGLPPTGKMLRRVAFLGGDIPEVKGLGDIPPVEGDGESVLGIPLFASGDYRGKDYSDADQADIERNFRLYSTGDNPPFPVPAVVGHSEDQSWLADTGLPAAGWVVNCTVGSMAETMRFSELGAAFSGRAYAIPLAGGSWAVFSEVGTSYSDHALASGALGTADGPVSGDWGNVATHGNEAVSSALGDPGLSEAIAQAVYEAFAEPTPEERRIAAYYRREGSSTHRMSKERADQANAGRGHLTGNDVINFGVAAANRDRAEHFDPTTPARIPDTMAEMGDQMDAQGMDGQQNTNPANATPDQPASDKRAALLDVLRRCGVDAALFESLDDAALAEAVRLAEAKAGVPGGSLGEGGFDEPADSREAREQYQHAQAYFEHAQAHMQRFGGGAPQEMAEEPYTGADLAADITSGYLSDVKGKAAGHQRNPYGQGAIGDLPEEGLRPNTVADDARRHANRAARNADRLRAENGLSPHEDEFAEPQQPLSDDERAVRELERRAGGVEGEPETSDNGQYAAGRRTKENIDKGDDFNQRRVARENIPGGYFHALMGDPLPQDAANTAARARRWLGKPGHRMKQEGDYGDAMPAEMGEDSDYGAAMDYLSQQGQAGQQDAPPDDHDQPAPMDADSLIEGLADLVSSGELSLSEAEAWLEELAGDGDGDGPPDADSPDEDSYAERGIPPDGHKRQEDILRLDDEIEALESQPGVDDPGGPVRRQRNRLERRSAGIERDLDRSLGGLRESDMAEDGDRDAVARRNLARLRGGEIAGGVESGPLDPEGLADASGDRDEAQPADWSNQPAGRDGGRREAKRISDWFNNGLPSDTRLVQGTEVSRNAHRLTDEQARDAGLMAEDDDAGQPDQNAQDAPQDDATASVESSLDDLQEALQRLLDAGAIGEETANSILADAEAEACEGDGGCAPASSSPEYERVEGEPGQYAEGTEAEEDFDRDDDRLIPPEGASRWTNMGVRPHGGHADRLDASGRMRDRDRRGGFTQHPRTAYHVPDDTGFAEGDGRITDPLRQIHGENVEQVWRAMKAEIEQHDPSMLPQEAGEIAAARLHKHMRESANSFTGEMDRRAREDEPISDDEDALYRTAHKHVGGLVRQLEDMSGIRAWVPVEQHPLAQRPLDADPLPTAEEARRAAGPTPDGEAGTDQPRRAPQRPVTTDSDRRSERRYLETAGDEQDYAEGHYDGGRDLQRRIIEAERAGDDAAASSLREQSRRLYASRHTQNNQKENKGTLRGQIYDQLRDHQGFAEPPQRARDAALGSTSAARFAPGDRLGRDIGRAIDARGLTGNERIGATEHLRALMRQRRGDLGARSGASQYSEDETEGDRAYLESLRRELGNLHEIGELDTPYGRGIVRKATDAGVAPHHIASREVARQRAQAKRGLSQYDEPAYEGSDDDDREENSGQQRARMQKQYRPYHAARTASTQADSDLDAGHHVADAGAKRRDYERLADKHNVMPGDRRNFDEQRGPDEDERRAMRERRDAPRDDEFEDNLGKWQQGMNARLDRLDSRADVLRAIRERARSMNMAEAEGHLSDDPEMTPLAAEEREAQQWDDRRARSREHTRAEALGQVFRGTKAGLKATRRSFPNEQHRNMSEMTKLAERRTERIGGGRRVSAEELAYIRELESRGYRVSDYSEEQDRERISADLRSGGPGELARGRERLIEQQAKRHRRDVEEGLSTPEEAGQDTAGALRWQKRLLRSDRQVYGHSEDDPSPEEVQRDIYRTAGHPHHPPLNRDATGRITPGWYRDGMETVARNAAHHRRRVAQGTMTPEQAQWRQDEHARLLGQSRAAGDNPEQYYPHSEDDSPLDRHGRPITPSGQPSEGERRSSSEDRSGDTMRLKQGIIDRSWYDYRDKNLRQWRNGLAGRTSSEDMGEPHNDDIPYKQRLNQAEDRVWEDYRKGPMGKRERDAAHLEADNIDEEIQAQRRERRGAKTGHPVRPAGGQGQEDRYPGQALAEDREYESARRYLAGASNNGQRQPADAGGDPHADYSKEQNQRADEAAALMRRPKREVRERVTGAARQYAPPAEYDEGDATYRGASHLDRLRRAESGADEDARALSDLKGKPAGSVRRTSQETEADRARSRANVSGSLRDRLRSRVGLPPVGEDHGRSDLRGQGREQAYSPEQEFGEAEDAARLGGRAASRDLPGRKRLRELPPHPNLIEEWRSRDEGPLDPKSGQRVRRMRHPAPEYSGLGDHIDPISYQHHAEGNGSPCPPVDAASSSAVDLFTQRGRKLRRFSETPESHDQRGETMAGTHPSDIQRAINEGVRAAIPGLVNAIRREMAGDVKAGVGAIAAERIKAEKFAEVQRASVDAADVDRELKELVESGRVPPAELTKQRAVLLMLDNNKVHKFTENGKEVTATARGLALQQLKDRPSKFAEHFADPSQASAPADPEKAKVEQHWNSFSESFGKHTPKTEFLTAFDNARKIDPTVTADRFLNLK